MSCIKLFSYQKKIFSHNSTPTYYYSSIVKVLKIKALIFKNNPHFNWAVIKISIKLVKILNETKKRKEDCKMIDEKERGEDII